MDRTAREAFLAVVEAEEDFLETCKNTSNPVLNSSARGRSLSAAGSATKLKDRNLIPPLNTPKIGGSAWLQDGALESKVSQYFDQYTLVCITRNRQTFAGNGRQYGGVALLFRNKTSHFKAFPLVNSQNFELLVVSLKEMVLREKSFA